MSRRPVAASTCDASGMVPCRSATTGASMRLRTRSARETGALCGRAEEHAPGPAPRSRASAASRTGREQALAAVRVAMTSTPPTPTTVEAVLAPTSMSASASSTWAIGGRRVAQQRVEPPSCATAQGRHRRRTGRSSPSMQGVEEASGSCRRARSHRLVLRQRDLLRRRAGLWSQVGERLAVAADVLVRAAERDQQHGRCGARLAIWRRTLGATRASSPWPSSRGSPSIGQRERAGEDDVDLLLVEVAVDAPALAGRSRIWLRPKRLTPSWRRSEDEALLRVGVELGVADAVLHRTSCAAEIQVSASAAVAAAVVAAEAELGGAGRPAATPSGRARGGRIRRRAARADAGRVGEEVGGEVDVGAARRARGQLEPATARGRRRGGRQSRGAGGRHGPAASREAVEQLGPEHVERVQAAAETSICPWSAGDEQHRAGRKHGAFERSSASRDSRDRRSRWMGRGWCPAASIASQ